MVTKLELKSNTEMSIIAVEYGLWHIMNRIVCCNLPPDFLKLTSLHLVKIMLTVSVVCLYYAVCQNNCSGHGQCSQATKRCICSGFWTEDIFRAHFGEQESNCGKNDFLLITFSKYCIKDLACCPALS